jgi:hypothetical protein
MISRARTFVTRFCSNAFFNIGPGLPEANFVGHATHLSVFIFRTVRNHTNQSDGARVTRINNIKREKVRIRRNHQ